MKLPFLHKIIIKKDNLYVIKGFRNYQQTRFIFFNQGEGAYSSVYKVQRHVDGQIYALKKVKMNNLS